MNPSRHCVLLAGLSLASLPLLAQEQVDSLSVDSGVSMPEVSVPGLSAQDLEELTRPIDPAGGAMTDPMGGGLGAASSGRDIPLTPVLGSQYAVPSFAGVAHQSSFYPHWDTGYVYGYSSQYNDWLRGYQASAGVGLTQTFGDYWRLNLSAQLHKNSIYYNTASFGGSLHWQANRNVGVTVFGDYSPGTFMSPVSFGPTFNFGGYVTMEGEYLGIDLGAQQYYDPFSGHDTEPIVRPFVKLGGAKLGIDVGPMIKDALQHDRGHGNGFNPIPQPIKAVPRVAPRR